jgi:hypothetical protein
VPQSEDSPRSVSAEARVIPETIDAMIAAGASAEVIGAAWKAELAAQERALTYRRSKDAERQRRHRESRDVTVTGCDTSSPNERDILTPTRIQKPKSKDLVKKSVVEIEKLEAVGSCLKVAFPPPTGVSDEQWTAFRKQRKKPLNSRSYTLLTNKLLVLAEAGWPPGDMIDLAIERGWETVFEPRNFGHERSDRDPTTVAVERLLRGNVLPHAGTG